MRNALFACLLALSALAGCVSPAGNDAPTPRAISTVKVVLQGGSHGSGVHIGGGFLLTSAHVVDRPGAAPAPIRIKTSSGRETGATVLWANGPYDVALLRLDSADGIDAAKLHCRDVDVGEVLISRGSPGRIEFVQTYGRVAGKVRRVESIEAVFVFDGTVVPGMSGGGVFDARNRLVGINAAVMAVPVGFSASIVPVSYIVPSSTICMLLARKA